MATAVPKVSRDMLEALVQDRHGNPCQVARLLNSITDQETKDTVIAALAYPKEALSAVRLRQILLDWGFAPEIVPNIRHIQHHRSGREACRCKPDAQS